MTETTEPSEIEPTSAEAIEVEPAGEQPARQQPAGERPAGEQPAGTRRLTRSRRDRVVAGVCGGLGNYLGIDPVWVRIGFVVLTFVSSGAAILAYVVGWIVIPEAGDDEAPSAAPTNVATVAGVVLILVGVAAIADELVPWFDRVFWPVVVIALGVGILVAGRGRDRER